MRVPILEITKEQRERIVSSLKQEAENFRKAAYHIDANGRNCLTRKEMEIISYLPKEMRETAENNLLEKSKWQEKMYTEYMQLADLLAKSELFVKKD